LLLYCIIVADIYQDYPDLCTRLLLLLLEQSEETDTRHLGDLETHTGNITLGMAGTTEASHQHLVVFLEEVEATITWHEGCDLLAVLDELHTDRLTDSGVRLLGLNSYFLEHNALGMRGSTKRVALDGGTEVPLLVVLVGPLLDATMIAQLTSTSDSTWLTAQQKRITRE